jgi:hypothetical protein
MSSNSPRPLGHSNRTLRRKYEGVREELDKHAAVMRERNARFIKLRAGAKAKAAWAARKAEQRRDVA